MTIAPPGAADLVSVITKTSDDHLGLKRRKQLAWNGTHRAWYSGCRVQGLGRLVYFMVRHLSGIHQLGDHFVDDDQQSVVVLAHLQGVGFM